MTETRHLSFDKGIRSSSGVWYNVIEPIGEGRNAIAYLVLAADGPYRGIPFALKIFYRLDSPASRERFLEESRFLQECDHPAVMRIHDTGSFRGEFANQYPFLIAEYLPETLEAVIRAGHPGTLQKLVFSLSLLSALCYLHSRNPPVVHRDVKPANIFVKGTWCVLGDFGLIKLLGTDEERAPDADESGGQRMPRSYRTPDIVAYLKGQAELTTKSDIFQLGLVLAELFTGRNPEKPSEDILAPIELASLGPLPEAVGAQVAGAILAMLEMDPAHRPDAEELLGRWRKIFRGAAARSLELDGRVVR